MRLSGHRVFFSEKSRRQPGLKVKGFGGGAQPPALSSAPQLRGEWGGRLREGIR